MAMGQQKRLPTYERTDSRPVRGGLRLGRGGVVIAISQDYSTSVGLQHLDLPPRACLSSA